MKNVLSLLICFFISFFGFAQTGKGVQKITSVMPNLIGYNNIGYDTNGVVIFYDSASFNYSNGRGGDLNTQDPVKYDYYSYLQHYQVGRIFSLYDTGVTYQALAGQSYLPLYRQLNTYSNTNALLQSIIQFWNIHLGNSGDWQNQGKFNYHYNASNRDTLFEEFSLNVINSSWVPNQRTFISYSTTGYDTLMINQRYNKTLSLYLNVKRAFYTFDNSGNNTIEVSQHWDTSSGSWVNGNRDIRSFNAANLVIKRYEEEWDTLLHQFDTIACYKTYYTNQNQITSFSNQNYYNSLFYNSDSNSYIYQSGTNNVIKAYTFNWSTSWLAADISTLYYDGGNNNIYSISSGYDHGIFVDSFRSYNSFNSYHQPIHSFNDIWKNGTWKTNTNVFYYYDKKDSVNTGISNLLPYSPSLIFPNPSSHTITIQTKWASPQATSGVITDVIGRVVKRFEDGVSKVFTKTVSVEGWAAGVYFLKLSGEKGESVGRFEVR